MSTESARRIEATQRIEDTAARWLARRDGGEWTAQNQTDFEAWLNASMAHRVAYWRLEDAWESAQRLKALGAGTQTSEPPPPSSWNFSPFFGQPEPPTGELPDLDPRELKDPAFLTRTPRPAAWAAAVLVAIGLTIAYLSASGTRYETSVGGVATLPMADGSTVLLNTDSRIEVDLNDTERHITLKRGEAYFDVAKDPRRPFIVTAGDERITALGTAFSVRRDATNDLQVIVTNGKVRLESPDTLTPLPATGEGPATLARDGRGAGGEGKGADTRLSPQGSHTNRGPDEVILAAGAVAETHQRKLTIHQHEPAAAEELLSWRNGILIFRDITLADAVAEFNRYNTRKIIIQDPTAANLRIAGSFRTTNLESFIDIIERGYPITTQNQNNTITISSTDH